jgi:hypothetical protein
MAALVWRFGLSGQSSQREFPFATTAATALETGTPVVLSGIEVGQVTHTDKRLGSGLLQLPAEIAQRLPADSRFVLSSDSSRSDRWVIEVLPGRQAAGLPQLLRISMATELPSNDWFGLPSDMTPAKILDSAQTEHVRKNLSSLAILLTCIGLFLAGLRWLRAIIVRLIILLLVCVLVLIWLFNHHLLAFRFPELPQLPGAILSEDCPNQEFFTNE